VCEAPPRLLYPLVPSQPQTFPYFLYQKRKKEIYHSVLTKIREKSIKGAYKNRFPVSFTFSNVKKT
jgi:hypothetical protein